MPLKFVKKKKERQRLSRFMLASILKKIIARIRERIRVKLREKIEKVEKVAGVEVKGEIEREIESFARELVSRPKEEREKAIEEFVKRVEEKLERIEREVTGRKEEAHPSPQVVAKKEGRVGADIKPVSGEEARYLVPFGFIAPLYKNLTGEQILKKVQELYHIPFDAGEEEKKKIREIYPLIPESPRQGEPVFAWAYIHWDPRRHELVYEVIEPKLTPEEQEMLKELEEHLKEKLDVAFDDKNITDKKAYLREKIREVVELFGWKLPKETRQKLEYYIFRDFIGLGKIEPLMHDPNIEDISCDGVGIPVYIVHRKPEYGQMKTNIVFNSKEELDAFVMKLAQRAGKSISVAQPLLDGTLPDGSRLQATLGSDIARRGSNFTIRKFTKEPLTPIHLMNYGTISSLALAYLWMCVEYGKSILVAGATATGKTTMLNAISLFIRPELKIVSIEDTAELQLPHENWIPQVARPGFGEKSYGAVEMFDLLKAALRQRPDYVIVGEVRGKEASVMFQGMATGHPSLGTIHADSVQKVVDRLTTPPINLSPALLENLDVIVFMARAKLRGKFVRRVKEIVEVAGVDIANRRIIENVVFKWEPAKDEIKMVGKSLILQKIAEFKGITYEVVMKELERRALFLEWLRMKGIADYRRFSQWIRAYYMNPTSVMRLVTKDIEAVLHGNERAR